MDVDVIIATYKRCDLLRDALQSVANQSYKNWKCWIAEDGESQETYETVKSLLLDCRFLYLPGLHAGFPSVPWVELIELLRAIAAEAGVAYLNPTIMLSRYRQQRIIQTEAPRLLPPH